MKRGGPLLEDNLARTGIGQRIGLDPDDIEIAIFVYTSNAGLHGHVFDPSVQKLRTPIIQGVARISDVMTVSLTW